MFSSTRFQIICGNKKALPRLAFKDQGQDLPAVPPTLAKGTLCPLLLLNAENVGPYCQPYWVGARPHGPIGSLPPAAFPPAAALWKGVWAVTCSRSKVSLLYLPYYTPGEGKSQTEIESAEDYRICYHNFFTGHFATSSCKLPAKSQNRSFP